MKLIAELELTRKKEKLQVSHVESEKSDVSIDATNAGG